MAGMHESADPLSLMLGRSDDLHGAMLDLLDEAEFDPSPRGQAAVGMCSVSIEHWVGLRHLFAAGCPTSAVSLVRLQFEALVRAKWICWAASELSVEKLTAKLTSESEQAAKNLPTVNAMIEEIGKVAGTTAPLAAHQMIVHFRDVQLKSLNSFVHGGIHPLQRHLEGYSLPLILQVVGTANGVATMTGMTLALLSGDEVVAKSMSRIQRGFRDCLPPLIAQG